MLAAMGDGTRESPWVLKTPSGGSEYQMFRDESLDPPALVCRVGKTELRYHLRCIEDLHAMLKAHGDWMPLGSADEQKPAAEGTVEAWARSPDNPVGGWYGLRKGSAAGSGCTCRRSWPSSAWQRSRRSRATTACAPSSQFEPETPAPVANVSRASGSCGPSNPPGPGPVRGLAPRVSLLPPDVGRRLDDQPQLGASRPRR